MITRAATILGAVVTLGGAGWAVGEYTEVRPVILKEFKLAQADSTEVLKGLVEQQQDLSASMFEQQQQLSTSLMELQFTTLSLKRKAGALDFTEEQARCRIAKKLDYSNVPGCDD